MPFLSRSSAALCLGVLFAAGLASSTAEAAHPVVAVDPLEPPFALVEGYVKDHRTGRPLANVTVTAARVASRSPSEPVSETIFTCCELPGLAPPFNGPFEPAIELSLIPRTSTDENGFYSFVVDTTVFRAAAAVCRTESEEQQQVDVVSWTEFPIYDLREIDRDFFLKTSSRRRGPPADCKPIPFPPTLPSPAP